MSGEDLKRMQAQATDLDAASRARAAEEAARLSVARKAAEERVIAWERGMQRAFKGILPRPQRRRMLDIAAEKHHAA